MRGNGIPVKTILVAIIITVSVIMFAGVLNSRESDIDTLKTSENIAILTFLQHTLSLNISRLIFVLTLLSCRWNMRWYIQSVCRLFHVYQCGAAIHH